MKEHVLLFEAIHALEIDVPIFYYEIFGEDRIILHLYGGLIRAYERSKIEKPVAGSSAAADAAPALPPAPAAVKSSKVAASKKVAAKKKA
jgi:hypothetical protein